MKQYIQYILGCLIFFSLTTQSINHLLNDNSIIIEYTDLEQDTNEDDQKEKDWKKLFFFTNALQIITKKEKVIASQYFHTILRQKDYTLTIITPPPQV